MENVIENIRRKHTRTYKFDTSSKCFATTAWRFVSEIRNVIGLSHPALSFSS